MPVCDFLLVNNTEKLTSYRLRDIAHIDQIIVFGMGMSNEFVLRNLCKYTHRLNSYIAKTRFF